MSGKKILAGLREVLEGVGEATAEVREFAVQQGKRAVELASEGVQQGVEIVGEMQERAEKVLEERRVRVPGSAGIGDISEKAAYAPQTPTQEPPRTPAQAEGKRPSPPTAAHGWPSSEQLSALERGELRNAEGARVLIDWSTVMEGDGDRSFDAALQAFLFGGTIEWKMSNYTMETIPVHRIASTKHLGGFANEPVPLYSSSLDAIVSAIRQVRPDARYEINSAAQTFTIASAEFMEKHTGHGTNLALNGCIALVSVCREHPHV